LTGNGAPGTAPPTDVCSRDKKHPFVPATNLAGTYVNVTGNASQLTITWTIAKAIVNLVADNGAAHYDICLGTVANFTAKTGAQPTKLATDATGKPLYFGIIPDCGKGVTGPCMRSRSKDPAGNVILVYVVPQAWAPDPGGWGAG
jgi:hypothetical protein